MLRLFFQSLEGLLGPALDTVARGVHLVGILVLGLVALLPLWRFWVDHATARAGLVEQWVTTCDACGRTTAIQAEVCSGCGAGLTIPWLVRWRIRSAAWLASPAFGIAARLYRLAGAVGFAAVALWVGKASHALAPAGSLHRLFVGVALLALAAAGRSSARALGPARRGLLARGADALQGAAAVGVLAVALFLAGAAWPVSETRLAVVTAGEGVARVGDLALRTSPEGEIGVEYLQVQHQALGWTRIVPIAYVGAERTSLPMSAVERLTVQHVRTHADAWERRGVTIRVRRDARRLTPGERYEIVETGGQLVIRRVAVPRG